MTKKLNVKKTPSCQDQPIASTPNRTTTFCLDGNWGNLCVASEKIGHPFTTNVDATIDNLRNLGCPCEIIVKNHSEASGKLWRAIRDGDLNSADHVVITLL